VKSSLLVGEGHHDAFVTKKQKKKEKKNFPEDKQLNPA